MGNRIAKHIELLDGTRLSSTYYILDAQGNPLAMYELDYAASSFELTERQIYGSARLGSLKTKVDVFGSAYEDYADEITTHAIGDRNYELSNHLGNVLTVVSDKLIPIPDANNIDVASYTADLVMSCDYSPFGVTLDGRGVQGSYRYGYQGSEKDDEIKGDGNSYTTMFRQLDPRVGRWLSIDPLAAQFPWQSPYVSMDNNPVALNDVTGENATEPTGETQDSYKSTRTVDLSFVRTTENGSHVYNAVLITTQEIIEWTSADTYTKTTRVTSTMATYEVTSNGEVIISDAQQYEAELVENFERSYVKTLYYEGGPIIPGVYYSVSELKSSNFELHYCTGQDVVEKCWDVEDCVPGVLINYGNKHGFDKVFMSLPKSTPIWVDGVLLASSYSPALQKIPAYQAISRAIALGNFLAKVIQPIIAENHTFRVKERTYEKKDSPKKWDRYKGYDNKTKYRRKKG